MKKNSNGKEYDNLVREIFYRRKKKEICEFFSNRIYAFYFFISVALKIAFRIALAIIIPSLIGSFFMNLQDFSLFVTQLKEANPGIAYKYAFVCVSWALGMLFMMIVSLLALAISSVKEWLDNNWKASEKEAKKILKNGKKRKK